MISELGEEEEKEAPHNVKTELSILEVFWLLMDPSSFPLAVTTAVYFPPCCVDKYLQKRQLYIVQLAIRTVRITNRLSFHSSLHITFKVQRERIFKMRRKKTQSNGTHCVY